MVLDGLTGLLRAGLLMALAEKSRDILRYNLKSQLGMSAYRHVCILLLTSLTQSHVTTQLLPGVAFSRPGRHGISLHNASQWSFSK